MRTFALLFGWVLLAGSVARADSSVGDGKKDPPAADRPEPAKTPPQKIGKVRAADPKPPVPTPPKVGTMRRSPVGKVSRDRVGIEAETPPREGSTRTPSPPKDPPTPREVGLERKPEAVGKEAEPSGDVAQPKAQPKPKAKPTYGPAPKH